MMIAIDGLTVLVALNGGLNSRVEDLSDRERSVTGSLLITQLSSTAAAVKKNLSCTTVPLTTADRDTLLAKLVSAATLPITGDIGSFTASAVITADRQPVTLPGPTRRWTVSFELIES